MGESFLTRKGGASFRSLYAARNPDKMEYTKGQYPDVTGAIIGAQFGTIGVPLHESAWTYLNNRIMPEDPNIHITAQIGRYTKTLDIPVTVKPTSTVLDENSWETIAEISAAGLAKDFWNIGDIKYFEWQGNQIAAKIIGFDHNDLAASDPGYNNPDYNGGSNKAGITFQWFTRNGQRPMNTAYVECHWGTCDMRNTTMPAYYNNCPADMQAAIRTADVISFDRLYQLVHNADKLFLLNLEEQDVVRSTSVGIIDERMTGLESRNTPAYEYYENGGEFPDYMTYNTWGWTRSSFGRDVSESSLQYWFGVLVNYSSSTGEMLRGAGRQDLQGAIYPAFCV